MRTVCSMDKKYVVTFISAVLFVLPLLLVNTLQGASPVILKYDRSTIISNWQMRIESFLAKDVIPLIDLESSLKKKDGERYLKRTLTVMDRLGVALIAFDGYQAPKKYKLDRIRFGDFVALMDHDNRYGRAFRKGAVTIGVVVHSDCRRAGHGPGVTTIMTTETSLIKPVIDPRANIANILRIGTEAH
ncbi:MAG TPA: DUF4438 domain-containing protein [bacterium]|nr:DUF4438 domain-containing protein [bacterium]